MMPGQITKDLRFDLHLLVVPKLSHRIIIGMHILEQLKSKVDIRNRVWEITKIMNMRYHE